MVVCIMEILCLRSVCVLCVYMYVCNDLCHVFCIITDENRLEICTQVLDSLTELFVHPKTDSVVLSNVANAIANLCESGACTPSHTHHTHTTHTSHKSHAHSAYSEWQCIDVFRAFISRFVLSEPSAFVFVCYVFVVIYFAHTHTCTIHTHTRTHTHAHIHTYTHTHTRTS